MKTNHLIIISAVILLALPFSSNAQVAFGTRHGISVSTLSKIGDLYDNENLTASYTGGVFALVPIGNQMAFQPEINYISKGRSDEESTTQQNIKTTYTFNYLQVPLQIRYTVPTNGQSKSSFFFDAGPYASIMLHSDNKLTSNSEVQTASTEPKKDPDFGVILGGGMAYPIGKIKLQFDLRYDMGLSKISEQPADYRTKSVSLAAGIVF